MLSQRQLAINDLGQELAERIARGLSPTRRKLWQATGPYGKNLPLGDAVVHFCLRILTLRGIVCLAPRSDNKAPFVLAKEWLGQSLPQVDPDRARADLLRRYLRCYGPSTRKDFAAWIGVQNQRSSTRGGRRWKTNSPRSNSTDAGVAARRRPRRPALARPKPPACACCHHADPYTQMRNRETIVDKQHQREVWQTVGEPGAVLADGAIAGIWRPSKSGRLLTLTVKTFRPLNAALRKQLRAEADHIAELRGASRGTRRVRERSTLTPSAMPSQAHDQPSIITNGKRSNVNIQTSGHPDMSTSGRSDMQTFGLSDVLLFAIGATATRRPSTRKLSVDPGQHVCR